MCDLSEFPLDISNEDELRAAYSALRVTIGTLIENLAVCIFCIFLAYVDWQSEFCFVQTSAEEKKADIEKIETLEKKLIEFEDLKTKLEATTKAHESDKVSAFFSSPSLV